MASNSEHPKPQSTTAPKIVPGAAIQTLANSLRQPSSGDLRVDMDEDAGLNSGEMESQHIVDTLHGGFRNEGWFSNEDEQKQLQYDILGHPLDSEAKDKLHSASHLTADSYSGKDYAAILESEISKVRDLFPEYGKGFLAVCLEVYNHRPEEVIQRIMKGTLHEDLRTLDTSLEQMPERQDLCVKGKGKLVDSLQPVGSVILGQPYNDPFGGLDAAVFDSGQGQDGTESSLWKPWKWKLRQMFSFSSKWQRQEGKRRTEAAVSLPFKPPTPQPFPWFFISHGKSVSKRKTSFHSIIDGTNYLTYTPELVIKGKCVICCYGEWVVIQDTRAHVGAYLSLVLVNMRSSKTVHLPPYQLQPDDTYDLQPFCVMTAPPSDRGWALLFFSTAMPMALIWSGGSWFEQCYGSTILHGACVCRGTVYGFMGRDLGVFQTKSGKLTVRRLAPGPAFRRREFPYYARVSSFLVGSDHQLFMVRVVDYTRTLSLKRVEVFKLKKGMWVCIEDLGSQALFINASIPSNSFCCTHSSGGNCLFFANFYRGYLLIYYMGSGNCKLSNPCPYAINLRTPACFLMVQPE